MSAGLAIKRIAAHQQFTAPLVVLSESVRQTALPLLEAMGRESLARSCRIIAVSSERPLSEDILAAPGVVQVDCLLGKPAGPGAADIAVLAQEVCRAIEQSEDRGAVAVIFDDLEPLLAASSTATLALLRRVRCAVGREPTSRILARFPRDTVEQLADGGRRGSGQPLVAHMLSELSDAVVDVYPMSALDTWMPGWYSDGRTQPFVCPDDNSTRRGLVRLEHRRQSGKVGRELAIFEIDPQQQRPVFSAVQISERRARAAADKGDSDPTSGVSFSLSLTEKQRLDKERVELPYLEAQGVGEIHYRAGEEDDWDSDDPDDDLEI
ncbi:Elongator complex protein [Coemansia sp. RSA 552]|nr:Elongator complex protein [Coemansia sp. RSA 552]